MLVIEEKDIEKFLENLKKKYITIDVRKDVLPPKKYFFPPEETTFVFNKKTGKISTPQKPKPFILFGLNLRKTESLIQLDEIMNTPKPDYYYFQKRNVSTIISIIEEKGHIPHTGIDLILEKIGAKKYKAHSLTSKGSLISRNKFFKSDTTSKRASNKKSDTMPKLRKLLKDPEFLKDAVKWSWRNHKKIWEKLGKECLGCGICTYVCPICHCFSVEDACKLDGRTCTKTRKWTACTLPEFSKITGGHKFHQSIKERYYNWFYHKFVRAYEEFGRSQCVACGGCKKHCPASIDIENVLLEIIKNFKKSNK